MAFDLSKDVHQALYGNTGRDPNQHLPELPEAVRLFLGALGLLRGVPMHYLVPHENYLPVLTVNPSDPSIASPLIEQGSLKLFRLDTEWVQCLIDGALSIGPNDPEMRATILSKAMAGNYVAEVVYRDKKEMIKQQMQGNYQPQDFLPELDRRLGAKGIALKQDRTPIPTIAQNNWCYSGFLMRSSILSAWTGVEVIAQGTNPSVDGEATPARSLQVVRFEQLSSDTIFCLCEGIIQQFEIKQPREALHFEPGGLGADVAKLKKANGVLDLSRLKDTVKGKSVVDAKSLAQNMLAQPLDLTLSVQLSYQNHNS